MNTTVDPLESAIDAYKAEYTVLVDIWNAVERKAQWTAGMAGIFLAAIFAFVRQLSTAQTIIQNLLLAIAVLCLLTTLGLVLLVYRLRNVTYPPTGSQLWTLTTDFLDLSSAERVKRLRNFVNDQRTLWNTSVTSMSANLRQKATLLNAAQVFLAASIAIVGLTTILHLFPVESWISNAWNAISQQ